MAEASAPGRNRARAGAAVLVACGQYFVAEAVASSAWRQPPYDYWKNYISDLGVVGCTAKVCSPLAVVMNGGFLVAGVLCILAAVLLAPCVPHRVLRRLVVLLATMHGLGSVIVGLVHSAPGTMAGTPRVHLVGAYLAIIAGNLGLIVLGLGLTKASPLFRAVTVALGGIGLGSGVALVLTRTAYPGLIERMAVDTIPLWEVTTGLLLLPIWFVRRPTERAGHR